MKTIRNVVVLLLVLASTSARGAPAAASLADASAKSTESQIVTRRIELTKGVAVDFSFL